MCIRPLELTELRHTDGNLRDGGGALRQNSIRGKPGCRGTPLLILAHANIHCVVVLRYIPIDLVQASIANLDVNLALKYSFLQAHKRRYHAVFRIALQ